MLVAGFLLFSVYNRSNNPKKPASSDGRAGVGGVRANVVSLSGPSGAALVTCDMCILTETGCGSNDVCPPHH